MGACLGAAFASASAYMLGLKVLALRYATA